MSTSQRVLVRHPDRSRTPVDPCEVYLLEAEADQTLVRLRSAEPLVDVRPLGEILPRFAAHGFVRIHRSFAVNPLRVRHIRPRATEGWELRLAPPVNRILPIAESRLGDLWQAFGGE